MFRNTGSENRQLFVVGLRGGRQAVYRIAELGRGRWRDIERFHISSMNHIYSLLSNEASLGGREGFGGLLEGGGIGGGASPCMWGTLLMFKELCRNSTLLLGGSLSCLFVLQFFFLSFSPSNIFTTEGLFLLGNRSTLIPISSLTNNFYQPLFNCSSVQHKFYQLIHCKKMLFLGNCNVHF